MTQTIGKFFSEFDGEIELHTMTCEESDALLNLCIANILNSSQCHRP